uniref:Glycosylation-dependent cell adhesion molecule 1 n=1 Tax=Sus scrofa TaxID=9823 RepID=A0A6F8V7W7_PIG|nr:glycosylation-dependent cell adhesion molecule 1 [Sus scrofa]BCB25106.1 glycosylation-dependent cell adhesion molecule 1 [Sus scrofa]
MKLFAVLLLASWVSTSLAVLKEPEDEVDMEAHPTAASAQFIISNPRVSKKDLSKEASISSEELVSEEDAVIRSARTPRKSNLQLPDPMPQEQSFRNSALQSEETTGFTPRAATTSEGKLAKLSHKIGKNLENTVKETMNYLKSLLPQASEVMRP